MTRMLQQVAGAQLFRVVTCLLILSLLAAAARSDTLVLRSGAKFEGEVVREDGDWVYFRVEKLGEQRFKRADILRIEEGRTLLDEYRERVSKLSAADAKGHYELACWCKERGLRREAEKHLKLVVRLDPDHEKARLALGMTREPIRADPEVARLLARLETSDPGKLKEALDALAKKGESAAPAIERVVVLAKEHTGDVQVAAMFVLSHAGKASVPHLIRFLRAEDGRLVRGAVAALGMIGPDAQSAVRPLLRLAKTDNENLRRSVVESLGEIGFADRRVLALLRGDLASEDVNRRCDAAEAAGLLGTPANSLLSALKPMLEEKHPLCNIFAALARWRISGGDDRAIEVILRQVARKFTSQRTRTIVRQESCRALRCMAEKSDNAALALVTLAMHEDDSPMIATLELVELGARAVPALLKIVDRGSPAESGTAIVKLSLIGEPALPTIVRSLANPELRNGA